MKRRRQMKYKKILVTGGAGYVGSVFVPLLLELGYEVKVYDSLMYGIDGLFGSFLHNRFEFIKGDIRDKQKLKKIINDCDAVIHLAALVGYPICKRDRKEAESVNVGGIKTLIEVIDKEIPIIFASTGSCYGNLEGVCREELPLKPLTIYGETKAQAEFELQKRGSFVIYRFATGYGISPRLRLDLLINDFVYKAVKEKNLIIYEKHYRRTFIHVFDMARAFIFALENYEKMEDEVYNVGSERMNLSKRYIAEYIRKKIPYYLHFVEGEDMGHDEDVRDYEVDYSKINKLGYEPHIPLEQGVDQLIRLFEVFEIKSIYSNV